MFSFESLNIFVEKVFKINQKFNKIINKFVIGNQSKLNILRIMIFSSWISVEFVSLTLVLVVVWFGCRVAVANDWPAECKKRRACIQSPCVKNACLNKKNNEKICGYLYILISCSRNCTLGTKSYEYLNDVKVSCGFQKFNKVRLTYVDV